MEEQRRESQKKMQELEEKILKTKVELGINIDQPMKKVNSFLMQKK
jgi:hypothetical protein